MKLLSSQQLKFRSEGSQKLRWDLDICVEREGGTLANMLQSCMAHLYKYLPPLRCLDVLVSAAHRQTDNTFVSQNQTALIILRLVTAFHA